MTVGLDSRVGTEINLTGGGNMAWELKVKRCKSDGIGTMFNSDTCEFTHAIHDSS